MLLINFTHQYLNLNEQLRDIVRGHKAPHEQVYDGEKKGIREGSRWRKEGF